jgi:NCAIR mutase (PurE)-related protein
MDPSRQILELLLNGDITPEEAAARTGLSLRELTVATPVAQVDVDRERRCGYPEVVYSPGKSATAMIDIFQRLHQHGQEAFATRVSDEQSQELMAALPDVIFNPVARTLRWPLAVEKERAGKVVVITAGTSDLPVAEEALETARWMGCETDLIVDVGVAGPHRLPAQKPRFVDAGAIVVVAGMEGALPSVVGGHVACPVIAVPTSVGYGANLGGLAALLSMINSCAANVCVVNIDAGFKGGYLAGMIARRAAGAEQIRDTG